MNSYYGFLVVDSNVNLLRFFFRLNSYSVTTVKNCMSICRKSLITPITSKLSTWFSDSHNCLCVTNFIGKWKKTVGANLGVIHNCQPYSKVCKTHARGNGVKKSTILAYAFFFFTFRTFFVSAEFGFISLLFCVYIFCALEYKEKSNTDVILNSNSDYSLNPT